MHLSKNQTVQQMRNIMIVEIHVIGNALLQLVVLLFALKGVTVRREPYNWTIHAAIGMSM